MKKNLITLTFAIIFLGCKTATKTMDESDVATIVECANSPKIFVNFDLVETTHSKFHREGSFIYNSENERVGAIWGPVTPLETISFSEFLEMAKKGEGSIAVKEGIGYSFYGKDEEPPEIIKVDSIQTTNHKWYLIVRKTFVYDEDSYWFENMYSFVTFDNGKFLIAWFWDKDIENDNSDFFIDIMKTIKIENQ